MNTYFNNYLHRRNVNYEPGDYRKRLLWGLVSLVFRCIPRPFYEWRNHLLRAFGAKIGRDVRLYPDVVVMYPWNLEIGDCTTIGPKVDLYNLGKITLGNHVLISKGAHLCAGNHDYRYENLTLLKPPIVIGDQCWLCADVFIGPGVTLGPGCIVGARAVVLHSFPEAKILGGNPAKVLKERPPALPHLPGAVHPEKHKSSSFYSFLLLGLLIFSFGTTASHPFAPAMRSFTEQTRAEAAVVLGGAAPERIQAAIQLWQRKAVARILVTGDNGHIVHSLRLAGVPEEAIIHEDKARNTWENAFLCAPILQKMRARSAILVTSEYHMPRAEAVFLRHLPWIEWHRFPAPTFSSHQEDQRMLEREKLARVWYRLIYGTG